MDLKELNKLGINVKYDSRRKLWRLTKEYDGQKFTATIANLEGRPIYKHDEDYEEYSDGWFASAEVIGHTTQDEAGVFLQKVLPDAVNNIESMIEEYKTKKHQ